MAGGGKEENDGAEKSREPTPRKLEQAREKGDVPQSRELHGFAAFIGWIAACSLAGYWSINYVGERLQLFLANPTILLFRERVPALSEGLTDMALHIALGLSPFVFFPAILSILSLIAQQSIVFSTEKITPKLSRISIMSGFKQKFGRDALVEFFKGNVKIGLTGAAMWYIAAPIIDAAPAMGGVSERLIGVTLGTVWMKALLAACAIAALIGMVDFVWQRFAFMERMMMTLQEVKDEAKESEGDPHFKGQRRQRGREIAMEQSINEVPKADVVITNPTHYAVALKWTRQKGAAPVCIAKGTDAIALAIRTKAQDYKVPVRPDPPLARTLFATVEIGEEIREEHYAAVAAAIRFADAVRKKRKAI